MHFAGEHLIFFGAMLVVVAILAGMISNRVGAPLLLVFLGLGMLAGDSGLGGIVFGDFHAAYLVGSIALAIILFDGGLRTRQSSIELAMWPASALAIVGVVITAAIAGYGASWLLGFDWVGGLLVGATVASTDAAAVFLLLHLKGTDLKKRVSATLEIESGINDPMAVLLTVFCVEVLLHGLPDSPWSLVARLLMQMAGGATIGAIGGLILVWLINRIEIASGLYPVMAIAGAMAVYGGSLLADASGFLAVYVAGLVFGNQRHRSAQAISRFHDGLAWLSQIGLFLMLGLLVSPKALLADLVPALGIAAVLMFVARPVAVALCLLPFRFTWKEMIFIGWVGLRGAVPIFLATIPVLAGLPGGMTYFSVAFVVVLMSLMVQGWTVTRAARLLDLELPPTVEESGRFDLDGLSGLDRDVAAYRVAAGSPALQHIFKALPLPRRARVLSVIRGGVVQNRDALDRLQSDDYVLAVAPPEQLHMLDVLFAARPEDRRRRYSEGVFGEFLLDGGVTVGVMADFYGVQVEEAVRGMALRDFMALRLRRRPVVGDRLRLDQVELVISQMDGNRISRIGIELEPRSRGVRAAVLRYLRERLFQVIGRPRAGP